MTRVHRDRVTVDLRGASQRVHERAVSQGLTLAAYARRALLAGLDDSSGAVAAPCLASPRRLVKVTVRLSSDHAFLLAHRSRRADMSQGSYLADLLDGVPITPSPGRREALSALSRSCDLLATISTDLNSIARAAQKSGSTAEYLQRISELDADLRRHLRLVSTLLAELSPPRARGPSEGRR